MVIHLTDPFKNSLCGKDLSWFSGSVATFTGVNFFVVDQVLACQTVCEKCVTQYRHLVQCFECKLRFQAKVGVAPTGGAFNPEIAELLQSHPPKCSRLPVEGETRWDRLLSDAELE